MALIVVSQFASLDWLGLSINPARKGDVSTVIDVLFQSVFNYIRTAYTSMGRSRSTNCMAKMG
jgi:hypothetical protein